ncbi:MAG TPA: DUF6600 domain-containing protein, partial [Ramlibacter sp.]|nr:DUF6600 domain-containing protein [Ramlibacter sp.]
MKRALSLAGVSSRLLSLVLITLAAGSALAQPDPPGRVARLHHAQGTLAFALAGDAEWTEAAPNRPLLPGDRLWTDRGSRGELHLGSTALRLDGQTQLAITTLDDHAVQLNLGQGTVQAHVRELADGENFEIDTPNLALRALEEGDFRVDVDAVRGLTRVTVQSGTAMVYGEGGQSQPLGAGQQVQFRGRGLVTAAAQEAPPLDAFDRWAAERDRREEQSIAARHVPRALTGYLALDAGGDWSRDATHGSVWMPRLVSADWAPFRQGHWEWIMPWGWTWVDDAPWGFATSHYGRWTRIGTRWAWVPGRLPARPVYAPELVGFLKLGAGQRAGLAWFPLAPGEPWRPAYSASPVYLGKLNRPIGGADTPAGGLAHQRRPEALSALPLEQFQHGRPIAVTAQKFAGAELARAALAAAPGEPERLLATPRQRAPQPALAAAQAPVGPVAATPAALPAAALPAAAIPAQALMAATPVPATPGQSLTITREQVQGQIAQPEQAAPQQAEQAQRHKEAAPNDPVAKEQVAKAQVSSEQPQKERVAQKPPTPKVLAAKPQPQRDQQQQKLQAQRELQQKQALAQRQQAARSQA